MSWTGKDVKILRAATLCEISHFYRAMRSKLKKAEQECLLETIDFEREKIALEIMKGRSVSEAFEIVCGKEAMDYLSTIIDSSESDIAA